jgi:hypothetical protein
MTSKNILFGTIKVQDGKTFKIINKAVFIEGSYFYSSHSDKKQAPRKILQVIDSKIIGKTNYNA